KRRYRLSTPHCSQTPLYAFSVSVGRTGSQSTTKGAHGMFFLVHRGSRDECPEKPAEHVITGVKGIEAMDICRDSDLEC
ncbi:hypothetical protein JMJ77_0008264, partial [Colletotrichum scovillei]